MDDLILKRCKYCDKTYEGTSESCCCSEPCNIKYQKYMKQREKTETPVKIFSIILLLIFFINIMFLPNNPISKYLFIAISLIAPALHVIFPFGEDNGLQKRGVKKTKILFRTIWGTVLIYILTYYFLEQF
ncbi:MAG: hypothetical protein E7D79_09945 [Clostridium perfringens]|uniref:Uncharacterized protein n=1 Tax=Clostridium perfringens TaxID=1502 RepID=A0AAW4J0I5_CLOPF|nr:hypothetical protein [Clostridium perfringens]EHP50476.1 hypothetical protein HMPREF9476_00428 [Clostridium perfringens WAL-14572]EJT6153353.1 hypothetical protein [Clostridium perfringens]ELC8417735.1 hypothetical protein [Clostridium perfringens]MBO3354327.1 hypothetical protein [Clostridium perfringens]MBO3357597.1 hypothetical protein [Clostridium perfringens]